MGEIKDKVEGHVKEGVGSMTGNDSLKNEGRGQQAIGHMEEGARHAEGKAQEVAGAMTGDRSEEVKGEIKQA